MVSSLSFLSENTGKVYHQFVLWCHVEIYYYDIFIAILNSVIASFNSLRKNSSLCGRGLYVSRRSHFYRKYLVHQLDNCGYWLFFWECFFWTNPLPNLFLYLQNNLYPSACTKHFGKVLSSLLSVITNTSFSFEVRS